MKILGTHRIRTTAYHPMSNGIHRTLKAAIRAHGQHTPWINTFPLGIRAAVKEDLGCSAAELVYGFTLRLPGQFFLPSPDAIPDTTYISKLKSAMTKVCPIPTRAQSSHTPFIHQHLNSTKFVFVRHDGVKSSLQPPYDRPFKVIDRDDKYFTIEIRGKEDTVSIDRLKPVYMEAELTATKILTQILYKTLMLTLIEVIQALIILILHHLLQLLRLLILHQLLLVTDVAPVHQLNFNYIRSLPNSLGGSTVVVKILKFPFYFL